MYAFAVYAPEPLDIGMWHRVENVVPARRPANLIVYFVTHTVRVGNREFTYSRILAFNSHWFCAVACGRFAVLEAAMEAYTKSHTLKKNTVSKTSKLTLEYLEYYT